MNELSAECVLRRVARSLEASVLPDLDDFLSRRECKAAIILLRQVASNLSTHEALLHDDVADFARVLGHSVPADAHTEDLRQLRNQWATEVHDNAGLADEAAAQARAAARRSLARRIALIPLEGAVAKFVNLADAPIDLRLDEH